MGDREIPFHQDRAAVLARPYPMLPSAVLWLSPTRISPSSHWHTGLGQGSWTEPRLAVLLDTLWLLGHCSGAPCAAGAGLNPVPPARGSPRHQHFLLSHIHSQGLGLLLRAEQPPGPPPSPPILPSTAAIHSCLRPAGAALPHFQPNCQLYNPLPGCCETPLGGEGSGGQAGQRSLCSGAAGPELLRATQGAGFTQAHGLPALAELSPCLQPVPCQAGVGRRELQREIRPYFLPVQFELS